ncbi:F-box/kelch-repeat protein [Vitis vinifera]|uniref:F-box/kelch-repeat protein n=1 Tax=Vitis vinifera TaxID=29760 RepID=A0A438DF74_VITVI|nr:F-box/kelch-repeat protein [Vitis vinifera]
MKNSPPSPRFVGFGRVRLRTPDFFRQRKTAGYTRPVFAMAQARVVPNRSSGGMKCPTLAYRVTLLDLETGNWSELPSVPGFSDGLPMFCQLVGVESELVVWAGGIRIHGRFRALCLFTISCRRRGGGERICQVRGGRSLDVRRRVWSGWERDECKGVFHRGKFHVIGGYCTEMQGRFERSAEAFDFANWEWDKAEEDFLEDSTCPRTCVDGGDMGMYMCHAGEAISDWCRSFGDAHVAYMLDLKSHRWRKLVAAEEFCGHVQSGCCLEI